MMPSWAISPGGEGGTGLPFVADKPFFVHPVLRRLRSAHWALVSPAAGRPAIDPLCAVSAVDPGDASHLLRGWDAVDGGGARSLPGPIRLHRQRVGPNRYSHMVEVQSAWPVTTR